MIYMELGCKQPYLSSNESIRVCSPEISEEEEDEEDEEKEEDSAGYDGEEVQEENNAAKNKEGYEYEE